MSQPDQEESRRTERNSLNDSQRKFRDARITDLIEFKIGFKNSNNWFPCYSVNISMTGCLLASYEHLALEGLSDLRICIDPQKKKFSQSFFGTADVTRVFQGDSLGEIERELGAFNDKNLEGRDIQSALAINFKDFDDQSAKKWEAYFIEYFLKLTGEH